MFKFIFVITAVVATSISANSMTVKRLGSSCQVCVKRNDVTVCKFYKRCPILKKRRGQW